MPRPHSDDTRVPPGTPKRSRNLTGARRSDFSLLPDATPGTVATSISKFLVKSSRNFIRFSQKAIRRPRSSSIIVDTSNLAWGGYEGKGGSAGALSLGRAHSITGRTGLRNWKTLALFSSPRHPYSGRQGSLGAAAPPGRSAPTEYGSDGSRPALGSNRRRGARAVGRRTTRRRYPPGRDAFKGIPGCPGAAAGRPIRPCDKPRAYAVSTRA